MTRLPRVTGREVIAALHKIGFETVRVKGSHHFLRHSDGRCTVVPVHRGETIGPGLLSQILRDKGQRPGGVAVAASLTSPLTAPPAAESAMELF